MKRFLKYYKEKKGITLVLIALMLAVLLFFLGMAVDISYMYHVKNQLQVAGDAAALAGAANLDGSLDNTLTNVYQEPARQQAWKFACKNRATNQPVYLSTNTPPDCDTTSLPSYSSLNGTDNGANGDIVVGHWRLTNDVACPTMWEPAGSGYFCRANGGTGLAINALKARPQRTDESESYGMPKARVFIGQIFRILDRSGTGWIGWSFMSARASAIASQTQPYIGPFPICLPSCSLNAPLKTEWGYDDSQPNVSEVNPIFCSDPNLPADDGNSNTDDTITPSSTPGQAFYLADSSQSSFVPKPGIAWTNFKTNDCNVSPSCDTPTKDEVLPYIHGQRAPDICNKNICTTNGNIHPILQDLSDEFIKNRKPISIGGMTINGWEVFVPVVRNDTCGLTSATCPGAPGGAANPYLVESFTKVILTDVITTGHQGIRILGSGSPVHSTYTFKCKEQGKLKTKIITRLVAPIACVDCDNPSSTGGSLPVHLVK